MEGIPVTLVVKAPNQQIEDQTIKCEPSWTIKKLKGYLSEVYPSKPPTEEQKLIYSGQLLPDTMVLKDVLRRYEGQEIYTVHLVCTPPRDTYVKKSTTTNKTTSQVFRDTTQPDSEPTSSNQSSHPSRSDINTVPTMNASLPQPENISVDGIRQRVPFNFIGSREQVPFNPGADMRTAWTGAMSQPYMQAFGVDANTYAVQMAWMQQAYANYMSQYMQLYTNGSPNVSDSISNDNNNDNVNAANVNAPVPENVVPPAADAVPADAEEGIIDRDWLDWFYLLSRLAILFSIVYFYSSPLRFIIVVLLGVTMYMYHIGFFRPQGLDNQINMNNNINERVENNNVIGDQNILQQPPLTVENARNVNQPAEERPSVPALMWTFLTTFFASLIPEIPNAV